MSELRDQLTPPIQRQVRRAVRLVSSCVVAGLVLIACGGSEPALPKLDSREERDPASGALPSPPTLAGRIPRVGLVAGTLARAGEPLPPTSSTPTSVDPCITYTLTNVNFETNSAGVTKAAAVNVDDLAAVLVACDCPFTLHGFADPRPTSYPGGNEQLSLDRASSVRTELVTRGVPPDLVVDVFGHGAEDPVPGDFAASRRVEIVLDCSGR